MIGQTLGHYEIIEPLGAGGMGEVYRARDTRLDRKVAIKSLPEDLAQDPDRLARFEREAKLLAAVAHPNIAIIHALERQRTEREADLTFLVLELIEGETLEARLRRGCLAMEEALQISGQVAAALEAAHESGVIHRDLKPANVMVTPAGQAKVLDFGIARPRDRDATSGPVDISELSTRLTAADALVGTAPYLSPEQLRGRAADRRADIWALGCLLYETLTSQGAFHRDTVPETLSAILEREPDWNCLPPDTPQAVRTLLRRTLEKDVDRRLRDAGDARLEIDDSLAALSVRAAPPRAEAAAESERPAADEISSVAVLPFVNMSADPEDEYFSDGVTEEIINALAQLENLRVAARASSFAFKGPSPDLAEVGARLNVKTVLEGSVRRAGDRLRITAQLIDVADGFHMWSKRFDREMHDVFAIQDEIAAAITHAFKGSLRGEVAASTRLRHSEDIEAYELCLRGRYFLAKRVEGLPQAHAFYERAVERDPQYALALAGLGEVCTLMGIYLFLPPMEAFSEARKAAAAALALDPRLPESHLALAGVSFHHDWDWEAAQRGFEKALELRHQDPLMRIWLAYFLAVIGDFDRALGLSEQAAREDPLSHYVQGARQIVLYVARRFEEAIEVAEKMIEIDPHNSEPYRWGGISFALLGRWEEAVEWLQRAMMLSGRHVYAIMDLASTLAMLGQEEEARELLAELEERRAREWIPSMSISMACAALGDIESALDWLELAYDERDVWIPALGTDPRFDPLRGQRRFEQMRERLGLPG